MNARAKTILTICFALRPWGRRALCFLLAFWSGTALAQQPPPTEYQVKAAFLYNFAKFVDWPTNFFESTNSPLIVAVLGDDPFGKDLDQAIADKTINGRNVELRRVRDAAQATNCHIVFVSRSEARRLPEVFKTLNQQGTLTIGEHDQFLRQGGVINFFLEDNKVCFEIDDATAGNAGLKISSQLLKLRKKRR